MREFDSRRFEHHVSEPKDLWDGDLVEMATQKRNRDLFRLINSTIHTSNCEDNGILE
jgi:hypothetical protein